MPSISVICDVIILVGAVVVAITNIWKFFARPAEKMKEKYDEETTAHFRESLVKELPQAINEQKISDTLLQNIMPALDNIRQMNETQNDKIEILMTSSRDILREKIMTLYYLHKKDKVLHFYEREALDQYYKDYKAEGGNSYIDKYFARMEKWEVLDEDYS